MQKADLRGKRPEVRGRPPSAREVARFREAHGLNTGVSLAKDHRGYYVFTLAGRSKSFGSPEKIPPSVVRETSEMKGEF